MRALIMMRVRLLLAALLSLALAGCGNGNVPQAGQYATIRGIVSDAATGQPVAGAVVVALSVLVSAPTGADGAYSIANVPSGQPDLTVRPPAGYAAPPTIPAPSVVGGQTYTVNIALNRSSSR